MDWIENHGEAFLSKHTGVGKSLHRARALQKRHDDFEDVAQVRRSRVREDGDTLHRGTSLNEYLDFHQMFVHFPQKHLQLIRFDS